MNHNQSLFTGVFTPMVTPLTSDEKIDIPSSRRLINFLMDNKTTPFVLGTTGEASSISREKKDILVRFLLKNKRSNMPIVVGLAGMTFDETIVRANKYVDWGVDSVVITLPNYFDLTANQIHQYYSLLSDKIKGNIIIYNIPKTIHMSIPLSVIEQLSHRKNIIGIKDSEKDEERLRKSLNLWRNRNDFFHLVGANALMLKGLQLGSKGIVPSTANFCPSLYYTLYKKCMEENFTEAKKIHDASILWSALYQKGKSLGQSIAALKFILYKHGLITPMVLPPLTCISDKESQTIEKKLQEIEISNQYSF